MAYFSSVGGGSGTGATITVSYSSEFYGQTITCSHGTKTYSKTAPSSGTVDFTVYEEGTWTISCTIGTETYSTTADIDLTANAVLDAIPNGETVTPTDDIEIWLACAGITDLTYTTLNEVLANSETYNALLGDSNACAYMKRSTTWSTDICASQYAMNLLGQYDTACDALLSDSTWASAIANSTYFESVLNVKVPTMTSNTTPEGECISTSEFSGRYTYYAFSRENTPSTSVNTIWLSNQQTTPVYIGYEFTEPVVVNKIKVMFALASGTTNTSTTFTVQGSDDGTTWTDIGSAITNTSTSAETYLLINDTAYLYYRINITEQTISGASYKGAVNILQFYGRHVSAEKIHGGNPTYDSFYRIVDGNHVPVTDPSLLDAGTYTIYSNGLAKATDLTSDYGKTVRICPNTKEIVVRPDISLYWYGYEGDIEAINTSNGWSIPTVSFANPTFGDTSISTHATSNVISGIGKRSTYGINGKKVHSMLLSASGTYKGIILTSGENKAISSYVGFSQTYTTTSAPIHMQYTATENKNLVAAASGGGSAVTITALWLE